MQVSYSTYADNTYFVHYYWMDVLLFCACVVFNNGLGKVWDITWYFLPHGLVNLECNARYVHTVVRYFVSFNESCILLNNGKV
jgi:hypothetical protein